MTNQARKDWPTAFAAAALLSKVYKSRFLFWVHTDYPAFYPGTYWNLHALATDYGLPPECLRITQTGAYTDSMIQAVVGISIAVTHWAGKWKLSQNQPAINRDGVVQALSGLQDESAAAMAALVTAHAPDRGRA